jgi:hypothetical protein
LTTRIGAGPSYGGGGLGPTKIYQFGARSFFGKIVDTALPINVIGIPFAANISKSDASRLAVGPSPAQRRIVQEKN